ncbi:unnamed protein product [Urochloa humidicola]
MEKSTAISCSSLTIAATGVRRFTVDGYSITKYLVAAEGDYYQSEQFTVGGHDWAIRYYPTTSFSSCRFNLVLLSRPPATASGAVRVTFSCTPLDRQGETSAGEEQRLPQIFIQGGGQKVLWPIIFMEEVMQSDEYVKDDCFAVQCAPCRCSRSHCASFSPCMHAEFYLYAEMYSLSLSPR